MDFTGEFETHITVRLDDASRLEALRPWCADRGLKCLHIVLDRGLTTSQPMLTRHGNGTLGGELYKAFALRAELEADGFPISRIKLEATPHNDGVPQTATDAACQPSDRYFEHHIKLLLPLAAEMAALAALAQRHNAHLSRNALRIRADAAREHFVTQRCQAVGLGEAKHQLQALLHELNPLGYPVLEVEEEFVVYDSNLALDDGWIENRGT